MIPPDPAELAPVRTMAEYREWRKRQGQAQAARHEHVYSSTWPADPGYYVYRLWTDPSWVCENGSLYVGMTGENGPRRLGARLAEHRRTKWWWQSVTRIDAAVSTLYDVGHEEALQIAKLRPAQNRRTEGHKLTPREANEAQGWDEELFTPWWEASR